MTWKRIIKNTFEKDSKAANEAIEMSSFREHLEKALKYETQDIRFGDFGSKEKVLDIAKEGFYELMNADGGDFRFRKMNHDENSAQFLVTRQHPSNTRMVVVFTFEDDKVDFKLKTKW